MQIILLERVEKLGHIGDVVTVKDGFARNYLLPNKKALRANEANRKVFEANRERIVAENAAKRTEAEKISCTFSRPPSPCGWRRAAVCRSPLRFRRDRTIHWPTSSAPAPCATSPSAGRVRPAARRHPCRPAAPCRLPDGPAQASARPRRCQLPAKAAAGGCCPPP